MTEHRNWTVHGYATEAIAAGDPVTAQINMDTEGMTVRKADPLAETPPPAIPEPEGTLPDEAQDRELEEALAKAAADAGLA